VAHVQLPLDPPSDPHADELLASALLQNPNLIHATPTHLLDIAPLSRLIAAAITSAAHPSDIPARIAATGELGDTTTTYRRLIDLSDLAPSCTLAHATALRLLAELHPCQTAWRDLRSAINHYLNKLEGHHMTKPTARMSANGTISITLDGRLIACDRRNWHSARTRDQFLRELRSRHPDIDTTTLAQQLIAYAATPRPQPDRTTNLPGRPIQLSDHPDPPNPQPLHQTLDQLEQTLAQHLHAPPEAHTAITLWAAHTHATNLYLSPLLAITSPTKRCGKTRALQLLAPAVRRPVFAASLTPAAAYRLLDEHSPLTLLIDEADAQQLQDLRPIINAGHTTDTAYVLRCVGDDHQVRQFRTFGPKAIAGIGTLPATWLDRAIHVQLTRKPTTIRLPAIDHALRQHLHQLGAHLAAHLRKHPLPQPSPTTLPIHDRAADNWQPLLALAAAAGPPWPAKARAAAIALTNQNHDTPELLLVAIARLTRDPNERITASELAARLLADAESPWHTYRGGPITPQHIGRILANFRVPQHRSPTSRTYLARDIQAAAEAYQ
jgi:putative DNA primase/helicase